MNRSDQISVLMAFRKVLEQELHNIKERPDILWQQMYNRLQWEDEEKKDKPVTQIITPELKIRSKSDSKKWLKLKIRLLESEKSILMTINEHEDRVNSCTFSPDGRFILSASNDGTLKFWDVKKGKAERKLEHDKGVNYCAFSADGQMIISGGKDHTLKLWDVKTSMVKAVFKGHNDVVNYCTFSPDAKTIISASDDGTLKIWNSTTYKENCTIEYGHSPITSCSFSPDGEIIVFTSNDGTLSSLSAINYEKLSNISSVESQSLNCCAFSPDGFKIVAGGEVNGQHHIPEGFDAGEEGELDCNATFDHFDFNIDEEKHSKEITACTFNPDGSFVVTGSADKHILFWDLVQHKCMAKLRGHTSTISSFAFSPNGKLLASSSWDCTIKIWDVERAEPVYEGSHNDSISCCAFSPDGSKAISGSMNILPIIWNVHTGSILPHIQVQLDSPSTSCAFSTDEKNLVIVTRHGNLILWDIVNNKEIAHTSQRIGINFEEATINSCAFSPEGKYIITASGIDSDAGEGTLILWDAKDGSEIDILAEGSAWSNCTFSPDGKKIFCVDKGCGGIVLWDVKNKEKIKIIRNPEHWVTCYSLSPDGKMIVSISDCGIIKLWDAETYDEIKTFDSDTGDNPSCDFSPDGNILVIASYSWILEIRSIINDARLALLPSLGPLTCCAFNSTGMEVCCGDAGGNFYLVQLMGFNAATSYQNTETPETKELERTLSTNREELHSEAERVTHQITCLFEDLDFPPINLKKEDKEVWKKTKRKKIEELQEKEQKIWKALEHVKSRQPGEAAPIQKRKKMDFEKNAENDQYLKSIKTTNEHLRPGSAKDILPRLWEMAEREEKNFFLFLERNLSEGKLNNSKADDIGKLIMGTHNEPTAIRLLFEMLSSYPEEPPRLEAGKILFADISKLFLFMFEEQDKNTLTKFLKTGLTSDSFETRNACMWAIFKLAGNRAFEICSRVFLHHKPEVRLEIARLYGFLRDKRATRGLVITLEMETYPKIRSTILWALGYIKDPGATRILIDFLNDKDPEAAGYAAWALGEIGGPEAIKALTEVVIDKSKHEEVRDWAVRALIKTGYGKQTKTTEVTSQKKISKEKPKNITCKCGQNNPFTNKWCTKCGRELQ